jgi:hypothetical protein
MAPFYCDRTGAIRPESLAFRSIVFGSGMATGAHREHSSYASQLQDRFSKSLGSFSR